SSTLSTMRPIWTTLPAASCTCTTTMHVRSATSAQAEFEAKVDDRDHAAAQIDDALDVLGHLRNRGDLLHPNDLPDLQDGDAIGCVVEDNGQVLAGEGGCRGGRCRAAHDGSGKREKLDRSAQDSCAHPYIVARSTFLRGIRTLRFTPARLGSCPVNLHVKAG